jgi:membrane peptidoglycan carboxypeptidase
VSWIGRADGSPLKGVLGSTSGVYGGTVPAGIWKTFMDGALQGRDVQQFPPRANVGSNASINGGNGSFSPQPSGPSQSPTALPTDLSPLPSEPPPSQAPPPSPEPSPSQAPPPSESPPPDGGPSPQPSPLPS